MISAKCRHTSTRTCNIFAIIAAVTNHTTTKKAEEPFLVKSSLKVFILILSKKFIAYRWKGRVLT